jgi:hypothetical protein
VPNSTRAPIWPGRRPTQPRASRSLWA